MLSDSDSDDLPSKLNVEPQKMETLQSDMLVKKL
jgi:hypothetical protein